jgi:hypothetical protein
MAEQIKCTCSANCPHHNQRSGLCEGTTGVTWPAFWVLKGQYLPAGRVGICDKCYAYQKQKVEGSGKTTQN